LLEILSKDVVSTSIVWTILLVCICHLFNFFNSKINFLDVIRLHAVFFYSTSIISNYYIFGLWLNMTLERCRCVIL